MKIKDIIQSPTMDITENTSHDIFLIQNLKR